MKRLGFRRMIEKWRLNEIEAGSASAVSAETPEDAAAPAETVEVDREELLQELRAKLRRGILTAVWLPAEGLGELDVCFPEQPEKVYHLSYLMLGADYETFCRELFSAGVPKTAHQVKDLMNQLNSEGLSRDGFVFDTALAAYLLRATDSSYTLPLLSERYLNREIDGAAAVAALTPVLQEKLSQEQMTVLFEEIEMPLCRVLSEMEETGFLVDRQALAAFGEALNSGIAQLEEEIHALAGHDFNILSTRQLGQVLFEELMLPAGKKTKTGWSTNVDVLEKLRDKHPIVRKVLDYRTLTKLKSTYADGLLKVIAPDGRIHTSFQMTVTATGRLSSTEPNLQNIPVRKELGAQIRTMFAAPDGKVLVDADYSQIELRLLAHISGDRAMQEAFLSGEDFHTVTASKVFNVGIVYGISAFSLAQDIGVRPAEAREYMNAYLNRYSGVRDYMHNVVEQARADGYVRTLWNRRRDLPELRSSNFNTRAFGERVALNMPIQGTAADIIKLAMVHVRDRLVRENLQAKLVLQVHDELIVECPVEETDTVIRILKEEMEQVASLSVPLTVDAKAARTWAEAH